MDAREYSLLNKLKKDKKKFDRKLHIYNSKLEIDKKLDNLKKNVKEVTDNNNEVLRLSHNNYKILSSYIAELNIKIYPFILQKQQNYGEKNNEIILSNISMLNYLQKVKKNALIKDKYELENKAMELFLEEDKKQLAQLKKQIRDDKDKLEIMENEKKELSLIKDKYRKISHEAEKYENDLREYKFKYEVVLKKNEILKEMLHNEEKINKKLMKELNIYKGRNINNLNIEINGDNNGTDIGIRESDKKNRKLNHKNRSLSDKNFLFEGNTRKNSLKYFKNIYKKKNVILSSTLLKNYLPNFKGYKSPLFFIKRDKNIEKKLFDTNLKLINDYNALNMFTNNSNFNSISDFINSFNNFTNSNNNTLSFGSIKDLKSTKINTISSSNSYIKTKTLSNNSFKNNKENNDIKIRNKKKVYTSLNLNMKYKNEMYILKDYINDLIKEQTKIIKDLKKKKAEEIRTAYQLKFTLSQCINDLNVEIFRNNKKGEKNIDAIDISQANKTKEKLLYILTYIYDNCFNGINNNMESIFPEFRRNNNNLKIHSFSIKNNEIDDIESINKRCFSSTFRKYDKSV